MIGGAAVMPVANALKSRCKKMLPVAPCPMPVTAARENGAEQ